MRKKMTARGHEHASGEAYAPEFLLGVIDPKKYRRKAKPCPELLEGTHEECWPDSAPREPGAIAIFEDARAKLLEREFQGRCGKRCRVRAKVWIKDTGKPCMKGDLNGTIMEVTN